MENVDIPDKIMSDGNLSDMKEVYLDEKTKFKVADYIWFFILNGPNNFNENKDKMWNARVMEINENGDIKILGLFYDTIKKELIKTLDPNDPSVKMVTFMVCDVKIKGKVSIRKMEGESVGEIIKWVPLYKAEKAGGNGSEFYVISVSRHPLQTTKGE